MTCWMAIVMMTMIWLCCRFDYFLVRYFMLLCYSLMYRWSSHRERFAASARGFRIWILERKLGAKIIADKVHFCSYDWHQSVRFYDHFYTVLIDDFVKFTSIFLVCVIHRVRHAVTPSRTNSNFEVFSAFLPEQFVYSLRRRFRELHDLFRWLNRRLSRGGRWWWRGSVCHGTPEYSCREHGEDVFSYRHVFFFALRKRLSSWSKFPSLSLSSQMTRKEWYVYTRTRVMRTISRAMTMTEYFCVEQTQVSSCSSSFSNEEWIDF